MVPKGGAVARPRSNRVWIKRRRNPSKQDGTQTVSLTLQYRDGKGNERFRSLGPQTTEEQAEKARQQLQYELTGPWSDDPQLFARQFLRRYEDDFRALCDLRRIEFHQEVPEGSLPRFIEEFVKPQWQEGPPHLLADKMLKCADALENGWLPVPDDFLWQFQRRYPKEYDLLLDYVGANLTNLLEHVSRLLIFGSPEHVADDLRELAHEKGWSSDPDEFVRQFSQRHPEEFALLSPWIDIERKMKTATRSPVEIVKALLEHAKRPQTSSSSDDEGRTDAHPSVVSEWQVEPSYLHRK